MKVNNYLVTGADLATMGYVKKPGATPPLDGNIMNKGEASANYYIDQTATPWSSYPDDRAPKYQDFPCPCVGSVTVDNTLEGGFDQYIEYQDCSGNVKTFFLPYGQAVAIIGCSTQEPSGVYTGCGILRGSVIGARLASIVYSGCCPEFYVCTTTTTTTVYIPNCNYDGLTITCDTPPPSTAYVNITNASLDIIINNVTVNGFPISGPAFPLYSGDSTFGTTNQLGVYDIIVYYSNNITGQSIGLTDSDLYYYCNATVGIGMHTTTFGGVTINGSHTVQIDALDGAC